MVYEIKYYKVVSVVLHCRMSRHWQPWLRGRDSIFTLPLKTILFHVLSRYLLNSGSVCAASLCFLTACSQSGRGFTVTDSQRRARQTCWLPRSLPIGSIVYRRALWCPWTCPYTVGNISEIFPYFAPCFCVFNTPRTVGRSTHATFS